MMNQLLKKKNELTKKKKGFTLVELIIVIAIIAILAAMAIPKFSAVRIDSKVSNDVAAAKNIQTQIATSIANGTLIPNTTAKATAVPKSILENLDGPLGQSESDGGKAEALKGGVFKYKVDKNENITIFVNGFQLYPETSETKSAYISAVKEQK